MIVLFGGGMVTCLHYDLSKAKENKVYSGEGKVTTTLARAYWRVGFWAKPLCVRCPNEEQMAK